MGENDARREAAERYAPTGPSSLSGQTPALNARRDFLAGWDACAAHAACAPAQADALADELVKVLLGRKGFEWWWHDIGEENQASIKAELAAAALRSGAHPKRLRAIANILSGDELSVDSDGNVWPLNPHKVSAEETGT